MTESLAQEFLEFIDEAPAGTVRALTARILVKCRALTAAEAGSIFILRGRGAARRLEAVHTQNDAVRTRDEIFVVPVDQSSIAGYVAATGTTVFVDDVDRIPEAVPYRFNRAYDRRTGFTTRSILCFPLTTAEGRVIGVVQLINRRPEDRVVAFERRFASMVGPVSHIAGRVIERMLAHEQIARRNRALLKRNRQLKTERERVIALSAETERAFQMSVELLARAAELYDEDTGHHTKRVSAYCHRLAVLAGQRREFCDEIRWAAALHDIGKMSVDHAVIRKRGRLDEREFAEMKKHTTYGYEILVGYPRLAMAAEIAHAHHEMWEGGGYPRGLSGETIPLSARITAIADVYDALRSMRPYKVGFSHARSVEIMLRGDDRLTPSSHFDPKLLAFFARHHQDFCEIWDRLADPPGVVAVA